MDELINILSERIEERPVVRHCEGKKYRVLCIAKYAESLRELVIYQPASEELIPLHFDTDTQCLNLVCVAEHAETGEAILVFKEMELRKCFLNDYLAKNSKGELIVKNSGWEVREMLSSLKRDFPIYARPLETFFTEVNHKEQQYRFEFVD
ncbi:DUF1653 domain-containing protein [Fuchsiella alkaliacetigena]|uniref:DUF1653 domain-containing protein n=1 Tax=Fuchsiella alkaliacetigena TaxID=957042 RepID=UPI00200A61E8|nr:DUF1653 domain-containing protein [Fuchsiella alkaliacetigena]MCK8825812.1 DUF1653 domain-containing protein [Fuchsiella alkaliacetigena]